jgi:hypothetical protein
MGERIEAGPLPAGRPNAEVTEGGAASAPAAREARASAAKRPPADPRRPYHVGVALGLTAGVYATSLAAVSLLQIDRDRALIADRQPVSDAIVELGRHHDDMEARLAQAGAVYDDASARYEALANDLQAVHSDVVRLGRTLQAIDRVAVVNGSGLDSGPLVVRSAPGRLPTLSKAAPKSSGGSTAPATSATTGASGAPP